MVNPTATAIASLTERIAHLEATLGTTLPPVEAGTESPAPDRLYNLEARVEALSEENESLDARIAAVSGMLDAQLAGTGTTAHHIKVPEPKAFQGVRDARELENFLWDMEQYFGAARIPEADKVPFTSMYLAGDAKLWWRTRTDRDISAGRPPVLDWETLKGELRDRFLPCNTSWMAREALQKLKHSGSVKDYVKAFSSLMLDIRNMTEEDKLFNFLSGLQPWAQLELRRQGVRTLAAAMAAADNLLDLRGGGPSPSTGPQRWNRGKERAGNSNSGDRAPPRNSNRAPPRPATYTAPKEVKCFICAGPHYARDCPKKERLNAILAELEDQEEETPEAEEEACINTLQLIGAVQVENSSNSDLMYVRTRMNGATLTALVDSGATHNFLSEEAARKMGLRPMKTRCQVKAVNSGMITGCGRQADVPVEVEGWKGKLDFTVLPLDDFDCILGIDFLVRAKVGVAPHLDGLIIMDETYPGFVPCCPKADIVWDPVPRKLPVKTRENPEERRTSASNSARLIRETLPEIRNRVETLRRTGTGPGSRLIRPVGGANDREGTSPAGASSPATSCGESRTGRTMTRPGRGESRSNSGARERKRRPPAEAAPGPAS